MSTIPGGKVVCFHLDKEHFRRIQIEQDITICHLYPTLSAWIGRQIPDDVNPRSHDDEVLSGSVPDSIEDTLKNFPEDFYLANRGETILAESVGYDPHKQTVEIRLTDHTGEYANHGVADGGTTDAVIARVQNEIGKEFSSCFQGMAKDQIPQFLKNARVHLEVIVGLQDRDRIERLVQGRNTSRAVKSWTMAYFKGGFDWLKEILEASSSPFRERIGYEENAGKPVSILEVIAILTLFHPAYNANGKAPTIAYSSKGRLDKKIVDDSLRPGYRLLTPIIYDILRLHDHIYCTFREKYSAAFPNGKLSLRGKIDGRLFPRVEKTLPLTEMKVETQIPSGIVYPLLAAHRAIVSFPKSEASKNASWKMDPIRFFDTCGSSLVQSLIEQLEFVQNNPQTMGKAKTVYCALHDRARLLLSDLSTENC